MHGENMAKKREVREAGVLRGCQSFTFTTKADDQSQENALKSMKVAKAIK